MLPLLRLVLTAFAELAHLTGATIDFISDLLAGIVAYFGVFSLLSPEVSAVSIESFFLPMHEFRSHGHIMHIGCRSLDSMDNAAGPVYANMRLIVRDLDDDAATIIMVDSNLQRENILPLKGSTKSRSRICCWNSRSLCRR